ncbi:hypothetical protein P7C73_g4383, partial [Tremellales sp. Uapishka_1]
MPSPDALPSLDDLPSFDARTFEPPSWATGSQFQWQKKKNGESSTSGQQASTPTSTVGGERENGVQYDDDDDDEEEEEDWKDASEGLELESDLLTFSVQELKKLLSRAQELKLQGNKSFTAKPPAYDAARDSYLAAIDHLPSIPRKVDTKSKTKVEGSCIEEVSEEEALAIENPVQDERAEVEDEISECLKAVYGNLGACYLYLENDKEAVKACTSALEIDPKYSKALQRRATANERLDSWSSLTAAQEDYTALLSLLPPSSPQLPAIRRALSQLPGRITIQQEKEKDEMLGKLKELGNGLLGKFGLSTDMFKFEQQEGGGYGLKFER